jgi:hypothetical protein
MWTIPSVPGATPQKFGVLQDGTVDFAYKSAQLYGQMVAPVAVDMSELKISGSAKYARMRGSVVRDLMFPGLAAQSATPAPVIKEGEVLTITGESGTVANSATFVRDLGAYYPDGTPLQLVTTLSAVGQYTVDGTGKYTLYTGDTATTIVVDYEYMGTTGSVISVTNAPVGVMPSFQLILQVMRNGLATGLKLYCCRPSKLNFPTKLGAYTIQQFDFEASADDNGSIFDWMGVI